MRRHFLAKLTATVLISVLICGAAQADSLDGVCNITVVSDVNDTITNINYNGTDYVPFEDLLLGTTSRWYVEGGTPTLWVDGDPAPEATVPGTSNPKAGDVGSNADNFNFAIEGDGDNISSIDGIDYQETIFPFLTDTIFVFERGGNDSGYYQAILWDGSLGPQVQFTASEVYCNTGVSTGQDTWGVVFKTDELAQGVRIWAGGHDTLSISAIKKSELVGQSHEPQPEDGATGVDITGTTLTWKTGEDVDNPGTVNPAITGHFLWLSPALDPADPPSRDGWWNLQGVQVFPVALGGDPSVGSYQLPTLQRDALYYWVVDESLGASSENDIDNLIFGDTWSFETVSSGPEVDAGDSILTWLKPDSTTVDLNGTVTDVTNNVATIQWSVLVEPAAGAASIANPSSAVTTVTLTQTGRYVLELYANDTTQNEGHDRLEINVYNDNCEAAKNHPDGYTGSAYDFNDDCVVNFIDFAMFAEYWLEDASLAQDTPYEPEAIFAPPFAEFTYPLDGATVSGVVVINVLSYDEAVGTNDGDGMHGAGIVRIRVLDSTDTVVGSQNENTAPFDMTWDTTAIEFPDGVYTIRVEAESDAGYTTTKEISVTVNN